jgi:hypothetical protein
MANNNYNNGGGDSSGHTLLAVIVGGLLIIVVAVFAFGGFNFGDRTPDQVAIDLNAPQAPNIDLPDVTPPQQVSPPDVNVDLPDVNINEAPAPAQ